jgi:single-stranded-DNA-specific exonuclease
MAYAAALTHPPPAPGTEAPPPLRLAHETEPARDVVPRLQIAPYVAADALRLERELGVGHVLAQILVRRGLADPAAARRFLDAREAHDPAAFDGIEQALDLIHGHIAAGRRIVVHGDYDVDGVCATAIMIRALRSLGADASWFLPSRIDDGYGLAAATVERLAQRGTALIVTVDCGITAVDEVAAARAAGMDVVVSDHHAPRADGALPDCPIVHPALSRYPCPTLCGAGVAYKLASALGARSAEDDLDLVALATVADLVPLAGENRRLVREGLAALSATAKPGLRALIAVSRADPSALDTGTLGFRLAPRINAAGRLRRADAGLELLLTEDPVRAKAIAAELDAVNVERRAVEQRILWDAESQVAELGPRAGYVLWSEEWHPGVVGIVASRIVERHHRPAVLVALEGDTGGGSGRSIPGFDLLGALHTGAAHLRRYGGHRAAAGLTIDAARLDAFRAAFEAHAEAVLTPDLLEPVERVDAVVSGHELGLGLAEELEALEPCGMGNPAPRLLVPGGRFEDARSMGEGRHARFSVIAGGVRARAVAFGCDGHVTDDPAQPLDATFRLERNAWNGAVEPRLVLRHAQPCAPAPIELLRTGHAAYLDAAMAELDALLGCAPAIAPRSPPRTAPPMRPGPCSTVAGTAPWRSSWMPSPEAARCWRCAPTSPGGCPACASAWAASSWPATASSRPIRPPRSPSPTSSRSIRPPTRPVTWRSAPERGSPRWPGASPSCASPRGCSSMSTGCAPRSCPCTARCVSAAARQARIWRRCCAATAPTGGRRGWPGGSSVCCPSSSWWS